MDAGSAQLNGWPTTQDLLARAACLAACKPCLQALLTLQAPGRPRLTPTLTAPAVTLPLQWPGINPPPGRSGGRYTGPLSLVNGRLARVRSVAIVGTQVQGADGQVEAVAQVARWPRAGHSAVVAALRLAALRSVRARRAFRDALALLCQMHALSSAALRSVALELVERLLGAQERQRLEESLEAGEGPGVDLGPLQEGEEQVGGRAAVQRGCRQACT